MTRQQKTLIIGGFAALLLVALFLMGQPDGNPKNTLAQTDAPSSLTATEMAFDFGEVSMAQGPVSHTFQVRNENAETLTLARLTTSCMCTTATFIQGESRLGPFGMPGHGFVPPLNASLAPGESAEIDVTFDPAAHGPAGIGRIERVIFLESKNGAPLTLTIAATVTP